MTAGKRPRGPTSCTLNPGCCRACQTFQSRKNKIHMDSLAVPGIPFPVEWDVHPVRSYVEANRLYIEAPAETDVFTDPRTGVLKADAPRLLFTPPDPVFTLSAHVTVGFQSTFDAGVLLLWVGGDSWAKLCFEFSPQREPMIVSVVNNGISDDCNSVPLTRRDVFLRISCLANTFAFHYSEDGERWRMVRHFTLLEREPLRAGLSAQSPTGQGASATFDSIRYTPTVVTDIRSGE